MSAGKGSWFQQVYDCVAQIPPGRVMTYGQIASLLGKRRGARTVGWAMRHCPHGLPWHRVVNAQGRVSTRNLSGTFNLQRALLEDEGIEFDFAGHLDLSRYQWAPSVGPGDERG